ncbi:sulfatase-like hydrolase/transferase [Ruania suaedae]|uniref:sulfatase family protein n=1 Tax=Ruania suaedae TaxID=2897774 RepID=UPI001E3BEAA8|nr:sulfatase-like hydrolase/transferase [Ruania suaedae]UFU01910.1 sulfatase-like hydrolase/transferase [Ruania suaedae]
MTTRPNVVLVMTDQQRYDTIAALGYPHMLTPALDRLVEDGVAFDRAYVTAPSCTPSRASFFTGLHPGANGVLRNDEPWPRTWVEDLAASGYRCVNVGKMHTFPYEAPTGFHERHVVENKDRGTSTVPFFLDNWDKALHVSGHVKPDRRTLRARSDYDERLGAFTWEPPEHLHADAFVGSLACRWLADYPGEEPFFLQVGFPGPHPPYDAPERLLNAYADRDLPPANRDEREFGAMPGPITAVRREHLTHDHDSIVHLEHPDAQQVRRQRQHYYANISLIDEQVGALIEALTDRGVLNQTILIYTSDHGDALNDHGLSQKWTMYEPCVRVPAIVHAPWLFDPRPPVQDLVSHMDLGATILDLAGVAPRPGTQARSLLPALHGEDGWSGREYVVCEQARDGIQQESELMTMVADGRWKLVCFSDSDDGQLFDTVTDPDEVHDRWHDPDVADVRRTLLAQVARWRTEVLLSSREWWTSLSTG